MRARRSRRAWSTASVTSRCSCRSPPTSGSPSSTAWATSTSSTTHRATAVTSRAPGRPRGPTTATPSSSSRSTPASETWRCPVPDYSEFPTTPTAWQERAWQEIQPLETEDPPAPPRRSVDYFALVPGVAFSVLAILLMAGVNLPAGLTQDGGVLWAVLIVAGVALLLRELRRAHQRR